MWKQNSVGWDCIYFSRKTLLQINAYILYNIICFSEFVNILEKNLEKDKKDALRYAI